MLLYDEIFTSLDRPLLENSRYEFLHGLSRIPDLIHCFMLDKNANKIPFKEGEYTVKVDEDKVTCYIHSSIVRMYKGYSLRIVAYIEMKTL